ncbi:putative SP-containing protein [Vairimorpha necatrix]|uniref:SP-containing protein n=1 Tax=Vairimorpha necatrix TaxID=6039 RepID=A0AAX4JGK5_9MICR
MNYYLLLLSLSTASNIKKENEITTSELNLDKQVGLKYINGQVLFNLEEEHCKSKDIHKMLKKSDLTFIDILKEYSCVYLFIIGVITLFNVQ